MVRHTGSKCRQLTISMPLHIIKMNSHLWFSLIDPLLDVFFIYYPGCQEKTYSKKKFLRKNCFSRGLAKLHGRYKS